VKRHGLAAVTALQVVAAIAKSAMRKKILTKISKKINPAVCCHSAVGLAIGDCCRSLSGKMTIAAEKGYCNFIKKSTINRPVCCGSRVIKFSMWQVSSVYSSAIDLLASAMINMDNS